MGSEEIPIKAVSVENPADSIEVEAKNGTFVGFHVGKKVAGEVEVFTRTSGRPGEAPERNLVIRINMSPGITDLSGPNQQGLRKALVDVNVPDGKRMPFPRDLL